MSCCFHKNSLKQEIKAAIIAKSKKKKTIDSIWDWITKEAAAAPCFATICYANLAMTGDISLTLNMTK